MPCNPIAEWPNSDDPPPHCRQRPQAKSHRGVAVVPTIALAATVSVAVAASAVVGFLLGGGGVRMARARAAPPSHARDAAKEGTSAIR